MLPVMWNCLLYFPLNPGSPYLLPPCAVFWNCSRFPWLPQKCLPALLDTFPLRILFIFSLHLICHHHHHPNRPRVVQVPLTTANVVPGFLPTPAPAPVVATAVAVPVAAAVVAAPVAAAAVASEPQGPPPAYTAEATAPRPSEIDKTRRASIADATLARYKEITEAIDAMDQVAVDNLDGTQRYIGFMEHETVSRYFRSCVCCRRSPFGTLLCGPA